jgi:hypothetical protein
MAKVVLHLNASALLRPNSSSVSPGLVPVVRPGVRCPDHPRPSWSGDGVAMSACDEPATSSVAPPVGVAPPAAGVTLPYGCVGWVQTGGACVNRDAPTSSVCYGASIVARI